MDVFEKMLGHLEFWKWIIEIKRMVELIIMMLMCSWMANINIDYLIPYLLWLSDILRQRGLAQNRGTFWALPPGWLDQEMLPGPFYLDKNYSLFELIITFDCFLKLKFTVFHHRITEATYTTDNKNNDFIFLSSQRLGKRQSALNELRIQSTHMTSRHLHTKYTESAC